MSRSAAYAVVVAVSLFTIQAFAQETLDEEADPILPVRTLTPGALLGTPTPLFLLCSPGHNRGAEISEAVKAEVFRRYGFDPRRVDRRRYEIDRLVPIGLDGSDTIENLWPQSYVSKPNARQKDALEAVLHREVCAGRMELADAQRMIASDWIAAYRRMVLHEGVKPPPIPDMDDTEVLPEGEPKEP